MKRSKGMQLGAILAAMLLMSVAFMPVVNAQSTENAEEVPIDVARDIATA